MTMLDFYRCAGGRRFIDQTLPEFVTGVKRLADALERIAIFTESGAALTAPGRGPNNTTGASDGVRDTNDGTTCA